MMRLLCANWPTRTGSVFWTGHGSNSILKNTAQHDTFVMLFHRHAPDTFFTTNCRETYKSWRGVKFLSSPTITPYGVQADFEDLYGNVFSLLEPTPQVLSMFERP